MLCSVTNCELAIDELRIVVSTVKSENLTKENGKAREKQYYSRSFGVLFEVFRGIFGRAQGGSRKALEILFKLL